MKKREIERRIDWLYAETRDEECGPVVVWTKALEVLRAIEALPEAAQRGYLYALQRWTMLMWSTHGSRGTRVAEAKGFLAAFHPHVKAMETDEEEDDAKDVD